MGSEKEDFFGIDESNVTFSGKSSTSVVCAKCVRWALVFIPTLISVLCLVAIIVFGVVYYRIAEDRIAFLEKGMSELRVQFNSSESALLSFQELLSNDDQQLTQTIVDVQNLESRITENQNKLTDQISSSQRTTYVRWGNSSCPDMNGTTLVYSGYVGGNSFMLQGGGSNHLCMPTDPEYTLPFEAGVQGASLMYGAEYESVFLGTVNENVPCAVCSVSTRAEVIMIPAKTSCPTDWSREYIGYLMSEGTANYRTMYICVDAGMESIPGSSGHMEASDLWHTEASCASLPCPPYDSEKELECVVCSK
ncbi:short-chain collagen C4-like [Halichondria panicea]|uniref:short-chain collagen C4-like n=1 Tax=Halichondria panicea TaxID=6063 RepID=UPI00312B32CC